MSSASNDRDTTQRTELSPGPRRGGEQTACVVVIHDSFSVTGLPASLLLSLCSEYLETRAMSRAIQGGMRKKHKS